MRTEVVLIHLVNQNLENTVIMHILHIDLNSIQLYVLFHVNILKLIFRLNIILFFLMCSKISYNNVYVLIMYMFMRMQQARLLVELLIFDWNVSTITARVIKGNGGCVLITLSDNVVILYILYLHLIVIL